jgi:hypothetical protein
LFILRTSFEMTTKWLTNHDKILENKEVHN